MRLWPPDSGSCPRRCKQGSAHRTYCPHFGSDVGEDAEWVACHLPRGALLLSIHSFSILCLGPFPHLLPLHHSCPGGHCSQPFQRPDVCLLT